MFEIRGVSKTFRSRRVLSDFSVKIDNGSVHGLLGANGSGKSTLIKVLAGYHEPDGGKGELRVDGETFRFPVQHAQRQAIGIGFVHQDLGLAREASVAENLMIESLAAGGMSRIRWREVERRAKQMLGRLGGAHIDVHQLVGRLAAVDRATVAIARALDGVRPGGLLVLDEVTAFLPRGEIDHLFRLIDHLREEGTSILFVSHRLEEVRAICDTVTVLRGGHVVGRHRVDQVHDDRIIADIVGNELTGLYPSRHRAGRETRLRVLGLEAPNLGPVTFEARAGEIIGVTGLRGMGHELLPYALFAADGATGQVQVDQTVLDLSRTSIRMAIEAGLALVPLDRLRQAADGSARVLENVTLPFLGEFFRFGRIIGRAEKQAVAELLDAYGVVPRDPDYQFGRLSGGNQQKVVVGRALRARPRVLILDEPTQGVDVGSRRDLFARVAEAAREGTTVIYVTSEAQDLTELCHRVLVFRDGSVAQELDGEGLTEEAILRACWLQQEQAA